MPNVITMLPALANLNPELIWGFFTRGLSLVYLTAFSSLQRQVLPVAGSRGVIPARVVFAAIERDFPTWRRFWYFPSLLWLGRSDAALSALPRIGALAALSVVIGGPHTPYALALCFLCHLSLDRVMSLGYPWDAALLEAGFWAMFLPATHFVPDLGAESAPLPALVWVFRLLVFRIIFSFGKMKFLGSTLADTGYLKSFLVYVPLPTPVGWYAFHLPLWCHKVGLLMLFAVEIILPFTVFIPGPWSVLEAGLITGLMLVIWLTGNFAFFNILLMVLAITWLDTRTALAFHFADLLRPEHALMHLLIALHTFGGLLSLPFNSFCANTWLLWPIWDRLRPRILTWPLRLYRALHSIHWLHGYGIFPPRTFPPVKFIPVLEATWDQKVWHTIPYLYAPTEETSAPKFCAPRWDRLDEMAAWEALGLKDGSLLRNFLGRYDPYGHGGVPGAWLLVHRMLQGDAPAGFYDRSLELRLGPPCGARVRTYMFEPTTIAELKRTGRWWRRSLVGPHFPPRRRDEGYWDNTPPPPELWHFNDVVWLRRSNLHALMTRVRKGEDAHELVLHGTQLTRTELDQFWHEFLPSVCNASREHWRGVRRLVEQVRDRYGLERMARFERIAARYGVFLFAKLEPPAQRWATGEIAGMSPDRLRMLCLHIVSEGLDSYDAVMRDPDSALVYLAQATLHTGLYLHAIFRYETLLFQSHKFRLVEAADTRGTRVSLIESQNWFERLQLQLGRALGSFDLLTFLRTQFTTDEDVLDVPEDLPRFELLPNGEVKRVTQVPEAHGSQRDSHAPSIAVH